MFDRWITREHDRVRLGTSPLCSHLLSFATKLESEGYAPRTLRRYLFAGEAFGRWLVERRCSIEHADEARVRSYITGLRRQRLRGRVGGRLATAGSGVRKLTEWLRAQAVMPSNAATCTPGAIAECLAAFEHHLAEVAGLTIGRRRMYGHFARALLVSRFGIEEPDWQTLDADFVSEFVRSQVVRSKGLGRRAPATATRAFLRFLVGQGRVGNHLLGAVPTVRQWKHASLPNHLSAEQVMAVIDACSSATAAGRRDRAIVTTIAWLGLRACEVASMRLGDIRWHDATILVRAAKSRRERSLPLPADVGTAIAAYLRDARPISEHREVFLRVRPPDRGLTPHGVSSIVATALRRAGVLVAHCGSHVLRHTAATRMVRGGASFKQIADVLGHARIETTAIYAKLDLAALARVALPWPGAQS